MVQPLPLDYPVAEHTLDNGLRVVLSHDPGSPGVAVNLWYRVGSGDEAPGATGFAHLFEHLMFCGSDHVANSEHLSLVQKVGGTANATTSFDRTNYFQTVPVGAAELMLWMEADRMRSLDVSQLNLDTQREIVKEEKRQRYDNVPYGDVLPLILELNFPGSHPYGHPTIGSMEDLQAASLDQVDRFYRRWYSPANALLTVVGPIPDAEMLAMVQRHFAALGGDRPVRGPDPAPPPAHSGVPTVRVTRDVPRSVVELCWRTPPRTHQDHLAVLMACWLLAEGQTSRLHTELVKRDDLAENVSAFDLELVRGTSLAVVSGTCREAVDPNRLADRMASAVQQLADHGPTAGELDRVKAQYEREWLSDLAGITTRADELGSFATQLGDARLVNTRLDRLRALTPDAVGQAAARWLGVHSHARLLYQGDPSAGGDGADAGASGQEEER